jgi:hypothetical protein
LNGSDLGSDKESVWLGTQSVSSKGDIKIISPDGGEVWKRGGQYEIKWSSDLSATAPIHIVFGKYPELVKDPYEQFNPETANRQFEYFTDSIYPKPIANTGFYIYKVPADISLSNYQVLIWSGKCGVWNKETEKDCVYDLSDNFFSVSSDISNEDCMKFASSIHATQSCEYGGGRMEVLRYEEGCAVYECVKN